MGVVFLSLHLALVWLGVSDLVALLVFAAPISVYVSYCTQASSARIINSALRIYGSFVSVVLAAAALVYLIGQ